MQLTYFNYLLIFPFNVADALWESYQEKLSAFVNNHAGSSSVGNQIKERPDYTALKDYFDKKITLKQLKDANKMNPIIIKILKIFFITIFIFSISNYLIDCIVNFEKAIEQYKYLLGYFILYTIGRGWLFLILVILYFLIFNKRKGKIFLLLKLTFAISCSALYAKYFHREDFGIINGDLQIMKLFYAGLISSLPMIILAEYQEINSSKSLMNEKKIPLE